MYGANSETGGFLGINHDRSFSFSSDFYARLGSRGGEFDGYFPGLSIAAGFQMHVLKPVDPAELVTIVASLAGRLGQRGVGRTV